MMTFPEDLYGYLHQLQQLERCHILIRRKHSGSHQQGFNRGGLSRGAAGFPVTNVRSKLTSADRDDLYEANINPIGSFPNEGIVIFGQKTLQVTPSALDRINVRRLMIFVKKQII